MTASVSAGGELPPTTPQPTTELSALREKLSSVEALVSALRSENHRLQAALAVERAARDADELVRLRRDVHALRHRLSRSLRVFETLGIDPPDPQVPHHEFIDDAFLQQIPNRVAASIAKQTPATSHPAEQSDKPQQEKPSAEQRQKPPETAPQTDHSTKQQKSPEKPVDTVMKTTHAERESPQNPSHSLPSPPPKTNVSSRPGPKQPVVVDESNPTADCLRMLIGADSIALHDDPPRIKIDMTNTDKKRALSFWLTWKDGVIAYTRESVEVEEDSCPLFLKEYSIEFEVEQAPNFLVLVMGAMFDYKIEPKSEPVLEDDPPQEDEAMREDDCTVLES